jgi:AcrR family transcriptional regulator
MGEGVWTPRQREIVERTVDLVRQGGLSNVTMKKIAELVGVSDAALYRHFPTKEALLLAVLGRISEMLLGPVEAIASDRSAPAAERLERILHHHVEVLLATDSLPVLVLAEASASGDEALLGRIRALMGRYLGVLESVCTELDGSADSPPPEVLAMLAMGVPAAFALRHRVLPDEDGERRLVDRMIPLLVGCLAGRRR